ncbi:hypothetical protein SAMN05660463_00328 [Pseudomonas sp. URIL14HWK12:I9]|nr:hypothetical protein F474_01076 [Pseudomonas sp. URIL14HWK12:I12]PVZ27542.1 hypothetical protein F470_00731 [Pseudomonas sp. URIL14HWK12:I10]PVZ38431.1 hypothetical protein F472_01076 [Pseudomonas sp. URIL14HWK12:I11]SNZ03383.1 hypothetical protein SAMN05660463_00328 [Pseudomonas sp. URIL14HWK12:I9]
MLATHSGYYWNPRARIAFERINLIGINDLPDMAGDHEVVP